MPGRISPIRAACRRLDYRNHRDGQQGDLPLTTDQSLRIYDILCAFTGDSGAIREGCAVINGASLGKGKRTGNAPLEAVLMHLVGMGYFAASKPDFTALNALIDLYDAMDQPIPPKYPLYGRDAHRTRAGVYADGLNKFWNLFQKTPSIAQPWFPVG